MRRTFAAVLIPLCLVGGSSKAALLRPYTEVLSGTIRLADLFDALGDTPDRVLGRAPAPGEKIVVEAPQLAAIARDFGVDWRPESGSERAVLQRKGQAVSAAAIRVCLMEALRQAGAPVDGDVVIPAFEPPMVGAGAVPHMEVTQASYDAGSGHFTALLTLAQSDGDAPSLRLTGQVVSMRDGATLTRRLALGSVISADDVAPAHIRAAALHGQVALLPAQAVGLSLKHDVAPGQPLTSADLMRPTLVERGSSVRMTLDSAGIALAAIGVALEAGGLGERIRVQNPTSHAVVLGEITGSGVVRVSPATVSLAAVQ